MSEDVSQPRRHGEHFSKLVPAITSEEPTNQTGVGENLSAGNAYLWTEFGVGGVGENEAACEGVCVTVSIRCLGVGGGWGSGA